MSHLDVIVVGTGGIGSAAAYHLASRGRRVLGLDRFPPVHDRGSSHGQTRLIRKAYFEHPDYVPLLERAYSLWRELERLTGRTLLVESGLVMAGTAQSSLVEGAVRAAAIHGLQLDRLSPDEAVRRWPALDVPEDWQVLYEHCGGYLFVEECVRAHLDAAREAGAEFEHGATVLGWREEGGGVVVTTDRGEHRADRLVLTPGPWAAGLLRLPWLQLTVLRKSLFWYQPEPGREKAFAVGTLPCFAFDTPAGFFYGFPQIDDRGVKLAEHTGGAVVADPLAVDRSVDPHEQSSLDAIIAAHMPGLGRSPSGHAVCLYTMSPDHHFLVGLHPDSPRVALAAGFSGHGFKFASVMGEVLADLVCDGTSGRPIGFLSPGRFC